MWLLCHSHLSGHNYRQRSMASLFRYKCEYCSSSWGLRYNLDDAAVINYRPPCYSVDAEVHERRFTVQMLNYWVLDQRGLMELKVQERWNEEINWTRIKGQILFTQMKKKPHCIPMHALYHPLVCTQRWHQTHRGTNPPTHKWDYNTHTDTYVLTQRPVLI